MAKKTSNENWIISKMRKLYYLLTPSMRLSVRYLLYFPIDFVEGLIGKRDDMVPPKRLIFIGSGDFKTQGNRLLKLIIDKTALEPTHRILDVGCGIGRLALPLTKYLANEGSYEGFDIVKQGIDWCNKKIAIKYPNFNFLHIDLKNKLYNLNTDTKAENFIFPYEENSFDRVLLTSVFSHMLPADIENYLHQIQRVLKKDGKCFATFFIFNDKTLEMMKNGMSKFNFTHDFGSYRLFDKKVEEANIAFDEKYLLDLLLENNLKIESISYGWWSRNQEDAISDFQDIVVFSK